MNPVLFFIDFFFSFHHHHQGQLPVRWMAKEAIFEGLYTHQSDMYADTFSFNCSFTFLFVSTICSFKRRRTRSRLTRLAREIMIRDFEKKYIVLVYNHGRNIQPKLFYCVTLFVSALLCMLTLRRCRQSRENLRT